MVDKGPRQVKIFDTTLRDGAQMEGVTFSLEDKLRIAQRLDSIGVHYIEGGWPGSNPKDIEFFKQVVRLDLKNAVITAFGSTRRPGTRAQDDPNLRAILESGVRACAIFGKTWDLHVTEALRTTLDENLRMIRDSLSFLKAEGLEVIYDAEHFFDGYKANREFALKTLKAACEGGADVIVLCDTRGGALPTEVEAIWKEVESQVSRPLGIHAHNDSGVAVANTLIACSLGAVQVQGTVNGYGERCGNADLCVVIPNLKLKMGIDCIGDDELRELTALSMYVNEIANLRPNEHQPYVGRSAFAHKGGIHVSAISRDAKTYEHVDPTSVGNRRRVLVSELSGAGSIAYKAQEYHIGLDRKSDVTRMILDLIKDLEYQGYYFESAEASFELLLKRVLGLHEELFKLEGFRVIIEKREPDREPVAEASVKIRVGDRVMHTVAEGDGPVNALDNALRKALTDVYPVLSNISLTDYKVRVIDGGAGTAAKVRVLIESSDGKRIWGTVGVHTNIIEASWRALADSIEYGLLLKRDASSLAGEAE